MSKGEKKKIVEEQNAKNAGLWLNGKWSSMKLVINLHLSKLVYRSRKPSVHVSSVNSCLSYSQDKYLSGLPISNDLALYYLSGNIFYDIKRIHS